MPWTTKDVESKNKGLTQEQKRAWVRIANDWLRRHPGDDAGAIRRANAAMKKNMKTQEVERTLTVLRVNFSPLVREETLEGRKYLVSPMVLQTEGVANNIFYPGDELAEGAATYDHKPIVINHTLSEEGSPETATSPGNIEQRKIGMVLNSHYEPGSGEPNPGKLKGEAWVDIEKAQQVQEGQLVLQNLRTQKMMQISTGVYTKDIPETGAFAGRTYKYVATRHRGDHLAILPHTEGASAGVGVPRLNQKKEEANMEGVRAWLDGLSEAGLVLNERSFGDTGRELRTLVREKHPSSPGPDGPVPDTGIVDVFPDRVVYEVWVTGKPKLFSQDYHENESGALELVGDPTEVRVRTEYVQIGQRQNEEARDMDKEKVVGEIIAAGGQWTEDDKEGLMALNEAVLTKVHAQVTEKPKANADEELKRTRKPDGEKPKANEESPKPKTKTKEPEKPKANEQGPEPKTTEEFIAAAPPEIQEVLRAGQAELGRKRKELVTSIKANEANPFTDEELGAMSIDQLQKVGRLATKRDYTGRGGGEPPKANEEQRQVPEMPKMEWAVPTK
jgi:hypothetical protein